MSKSKLKPEDIFFNLAKTIDNEEAQSPKDEAKAAPKSADAPKHASKAKEAQPEEEPAKAAPQKKVPAKKKEQAVEVERKSALNMKVSMQTKYNMQALINEMKMRGIVDSYTMTNFVEEAIEEKVAREKKKLGIE